MTSFRAKELAERLGVGLQGNEDLLLTGLKGLSEAGPSELSFLARATYRDKLAASRAGALLLRPEDAAAAPDSCVLLLTDDPYLAFARALSLFHPAPRETRHGVHPSAIADKSAQIDPQAWIGPHVVIEAGAVIGAGTVLEALCFVEAGVRIGRDCLIRSGCQLRRGTVIGDRVLIQNGSVLGSEGFGFAPRADGPPEKIPQVGGVLIEDDVEIGANCCVDRGTMEDTIIRRNAKLDNLIQIAHNVEVGAGTVIAGQTGIAGSTKIGKGALIGGAASIIGHVTIGDGVRIGGRSGVIGSIEAGCSVAGFPARPYREFLLQTAALQKLPATIRRLRRLEEQQPNQAGGAPEGEDPERDEA